jgi:TPR repeat protein
MLSRLLAGLIVVVAMSGTADAGPLEDATAADQRGDYATAMRLYRPLAEQGDAVAETALGAMYDFGNGVPQNHTEAMKLYRLAAAQGDARAQWLIGSAYYTGGEGVPVDYVEVVKWWGLAADHGNLMAQLNLGYLYDEGKFVRQDYGMAVKWYRRTVEQGSFAEGGRTDLVAAAQDALGVMCENGRGVPLDYALAYMWFNLAAVVPLYPEFARHRDAIAKLMTPDQIAEAQRLAREWKPTPAQ